MHPFLHYLTWSYLYAGATLALEIAVVSFIGSLVLGFAVAEARASRIWPLRRLAWFYVWIMRGTPVLLQLLLIFDGLPEVGISLSPVNSAILGFSLNGGAFVGEIIRGGIGAISPTQTIAARSLGLSPSQTRRLVIIPQTLRSILPALSNELIGLIKGTSLASVISVNELLARSQYIASQTFSYFPVLCAAAVIYLATTTVITFFQNLLERRFSLDRPVPARRQHTPLPAGSVELGHVVQAMSLPAARVSEPRPVVPDRAAERTRDEFVNCVAVHKSFGEHEVIKGLDFSVARGEVVALMGPSGSGKSTLLRMINHLDAPDSGMITVDGIRIGYSPVGSELTSPAALARSRAEARIGMVFQHFNLFDHMTAIQNVALAPRFVYRMSRTEAEEQAATLLTSVGLSAQLDRRPHQLSGGQQQRVAIARALAIKPRLMLFDEPTSALDPELVGEVMATMQTLAASGLTMIVVTHEVRFALEAATRVVRMNEGRIVEDARPDEVLETKASRP